MFSCAGTPALVKSDRENGENHDGDTDGHQKNGLIVTEGSPLSHLPFGSLIHLLCFYFSRFKMRCIRRGHCCVRNYTSDSSKCHFVIIRVPYTTCRLYSRVCNMHSYRSILFVRSLQKEDQKRTVKISKTLFRQRIDSDRRSGLVETSRVVLL